ncbi:helix-turn-helix transcriptional regulator [Yinghuangia soli]|nr:LuxR C-terminal-related transcriptional regulator [Yinghuangia soli]
MDLRLVGRRREQDVLEEVLAAAPAAPSAAVVRGGAGIGKTALLDWAVARGEQMGFRALRVTGVETEAQHAFAGLHQLVWPLMRLTDGLSAAQRAALEHALGVVDGDPPSAFLLSAAVLRLLELAAGTQPLLLVLDDLHWVDASSGGVFAFVQRRTAGLPVAVIGAARTDGVRVATDGARVVDLAPLGEADARELLELRRPGLSAVGRGRVVAESAGYPLALVELSDGEGLGGSFDLSSVSLDERLARAFGSQLRRLSPAGRQLLLMAALTGASVGLPALLRATAEALRAPVGPEDLDEAVEGGLIARVRDASLPVFRHPLIRAALVNSTPSAELRRAHAAWADVLPDGDAHRVTHLAAAVLGTDDAVAALLDEAAQRSMRRGGDAEAALMLARAAELGSEPMERNRRLTDAAAAAMRGGRADLAADLIGKVAPEGLSPVHEILYASSLCYVRQHMEADFGTTNRLYPRALRALGTLPDEPWKAPMREAVVFEAAFSASYSGALELWEAADAELAKTSAPMRLCADVWRDPARTAHRGADRLAGLLATLGPDEEIGASWMLLWSSIALEVFGDHEEVWQRIAERSAYVTLSFMNLCIVHDGFLRGRWDHSLELARASAAESAAHGNLLQRLAFIVNVGSVHGARGDSAALDEIEALLGPWRDGAAPVFVQHQLRGARALCSLSLGDHEEAYRLACAITPPGEFPPSAPQFQRVFLTLVEAAVHTGRAAEARRHVAAARSAGVPSVAPFHAFVVAAGHAFTAQEDTVGEACEAAYAVPGSHKWPFELARLRLVHGAWLRRRHSRRAAREMLLAAYAEFVRLKAQPWVRRAEEELRAAGHVLTEHSGRVVDLALLTAQELRVAEFAAKGLTNKEIGAQLRMSPRTVGAHLYKIFPKLGVTSRAALADALRPRR